MVYDIEILYFSTLFACIVVGRYYKKLNNIEGKKQYGAGFGFLVTCIVCRQYALYTMALVWGNVMIIKCSDKRYVNELSISFSGLLLIYISSMVGSEDYTMYINQILALRLVGLACEINKAERERINIARMPQQSISKGSSTNNPPAAKVSKFLTPADEMLLEINSMDVCTYAYHFIGMHKGPYYKYKEYVYHFKSPFTKLGDFRLITTEKLKRTLIYIIGYSVLRIKFSTKIFYDDSFYDKNYNTELRFLYNVPLLMMYVLRNQIMVMLSTCVFTETGFGVYPALCVATPGNGPSACENLLLEGSDAVTKPSNYEYNFAMLRCFDNRRLFIGPKMRDTLKSWDIATRYWFVNNVYSSMRNLRKEVKSAAVFMAWAIWAGLNLNHLILVATLWVWVNLEHEFSVLYNTNESSLRTSWNIGFSIMRLLCLIYLTPCLVINDAMVVLRFYNSINWIFHITTLGLIVLAIALFKVRQNTG